MHQRVTLPDGLTVWAPNEIEALTLYREIVTDRTYQSNGITLPPNSIVFDVGANIGLFAVHLARTIPDVRIHAFEPIPDLFEGLTRNLAEHAPAAHAHNVALSDRAGQATFTFDRFMTLGTTMHPGVWKSASNRSAGVTDWVAAAVIDWDRAQPTGLTRRLASMARHAAGRTALVAAAVPVGLGLAVRQRLFLKRYSCRLDTLGSAIRAARVDRIDLLKIDVEGAEEDVIRGMAEDDWDRVHQLVIEVHDVDGRVDRLDRLLQERGYRTTRAREDWAMHALLGISTLYAFR